MMRIDLLRAVDRKTNGCRLYSPGALLMLKMILAAQHAGFTTLLLPKDLLAWLRR